MAGCSGKDDISFQEVHKFPHSFRQTSPDISSRKLLKCYVQQESATSIHLAVLVGVKWYGWYIYKYIKLYIYIYKCTWVPLSVRTATQRKGTTTLAVGSLVRSHDCAALRHRLALACRSPVRSSDLAQQRHNKSPYVSLYLI